MPSVLAKIADNTVVIRVERIARGRGLGDRGAGLRSRSRSERRAVRALRARLGTQPARPADRRRPRALRRDRRRVFPITLSPERVAGLRLVWRGEVDAARALLTELREIADDRGEPYSYALLRLHLCELESRIGNWDAAARLLDEWESEQELLMWPMYERCRALLAAGRGLPDEAERWAAETIARAEETGNRWDRLEALRARGTAALLAHEPARAAESLRAVWEHTSARASRSRGLPGRRRTSSRRSWSWASPDEAPRSRRAWASWPGSKDHPWGRRPRSRATRSYASAADADGDGPRAPRGGGRPTYRELGLHFDRARALLAPRPQPRRRRKWGRPAALEQAAAAFDDDRLAGLGRRGAGRAGAGRRAALAGRGDAHAGGAARGRAGGRGAREQGDRAAARRHREHRRGAPLARVREARRALAGAARTRPSTRRSPPKRFRVSGISA